MERVRWATRWSLFTAGYFAAYFLSTALPTPLVWYLPTLRRFELTTHPLGLASDLYGRVALSLAAGAGVFFLARFPLARASEEQARRWLARSLVWSATLLVFTAGLYVYLLAGRSLAPGAAASP